MPTLWTRFRLPGLCVGCDRVAMQQMKGREINAYFSQGEPYKDKYVNISFHCQGAPVINFRGKIGGTPVRAGKRQIAGRPVCSLAGRLFCNEIGADNHDRCHRRVEDFGSRKEEPFGETARKKTRPPSGSLWQQLVSVVEERGN